MSLAYPLPKGTRQVTPDYAANGVTTAFPVPFRFLDPTDIYVGVQAAGAVVFTQAVLGVDYTLTGTGVESGGTATFAIAPADGGLVRVMGLRTPSRLTSVVNDGAIQSTPLEDELDAIEITLQELRRDENAGAAALNAAIASASASATSAASSASAAAASSTSAAAYATQASLYASIVLSSRVLCNGTDETATLQTDLANAALLKCGLLLPAGVCVISAITVPDYVELYATSPGASTLRRRNSDGTTTPLITMGNYSVLRNLIVDGNKANNLVGHTGVWGYQIQGAKEVDITVQNVLGMGDGYQDCARVKHIRTYVTGTQRPSTLTGTSGAGSGIGMWCACYTNASFYYDGEHLYEDCVSEFNDLDGLEFCGDKIVIRGGRYNNNGLFTDITTADQVAKTHTTLLGGALGAAGIYFASGAGTPQWMTDVEISGVQAFGNSESGLDLAPGPGSRIIANACYSNGTAGISLRGSAGANHYVMQGNVTHSNGQTNNATWIAGNPTDEVHVGICLFAQHADALIANNLSFDTGGGTQHYGLYWEIAFLGAGTPSFAGMYLFGNRISDNATADTNVSLAAPPSQITSLTYVGPDIALQSGSLVLGANQQLVYDAGANRLGFRVGAAGTANAYVGLVANSGAAILDGSGGHMGLSTAGVEKLYVDGTGVNALDNILLATGKFLSVSGAQVVSGRRTGWGAPTGTLSRAAFDPGTATALTVAQTLAALVTDLETHGLIGA